jgi:hypothetical protein
MKLKKKIICVTEYLLKVISEELHFYLCLNFLPFQALFSHLTVSLFDDVSQFTAFKNGYLSPATSTNFLLGSHQASVLAT